MQDVVEVDDSTKLPPSLLPLWRLISYSLSLSPPLSPPQIAMQAAVLPPSSQENSSLHSVDLPYTDCIKNVVALSVEHPFHVSQMLLADTHSQRITGTQGCVNSVAWVDGDRNKSERNRSRQEGVKASSKINASGLAMADRNLVDQELAGGKTTSDSELIEKLHSNSGLHLPRLLKDSVRTSDDVCKKKGSAFSKSFNADGDNTSKLRTPGHERNGMALNVMPTDVRLSASSSLQF